MVEWFQRVRADIEAWAFAGDWVARAAKTSLTHAMVWVGATLAGAVLGLAAIYVLGLRPLWAMALPVTGYAEAHRFYIVREYGPGGDGRGPTGWRKKVDSALDFAVPLTCALPTLYGVYWLFLQIA